MRVIFSAAVVFVILPGLVLVGNSDILLEFMQNNNYLTLLLNLTENSHSLDRVVVLRIREAGVREAALRLFFTLILYNYDNLSGTS